MEYLFSRPMEAGVQFSQADGKLSLSHLFGLDCGRCRQPVGSSLFGGLVCLDAGDGKIDTDSLEVHECSYNGEELTVVWKLRHSLLLKSRWSFCRETGVLHRRDTLENTGECAVIIYSAGARLAFTPADYEIYSQSSSWNNENQGVWQKLHHGGLRLGCEGGRTTQGGSPFMVLKESTSGKAAVFQLIPEGNWSMSVAAMSGPGDSRPYAVVEAGMADSRLRMSLAAGETLKLPELLVYEAGNAGWPGSAPSLDFNAWKLHTYYLKNLYRMKFEEPPIVYNTWFDVFEFLDVPRLRTQMKVAKKLGCEVFVIDAGWYGYHEGDWFSQAGDWREKEHVAFYGKMEEFAEEVRAQGMGFGLWMEPERIGAGTPVRQQHPEWFLPGGSGFYYPDLANPQAYDYILGEICRLIEKYKLAWMKIDFNFDLGLDPKGWEFKQYYAAWYSILDRIRSKYPGFFLEGCASGGMRLDMNTLGRFDGHFMSDNVNPWDVLSITQGALLRLPPGLVIKWAAMRSTDSIIKYSLPLAEAPRRVIVPEGATWDRTCTADTDFTMKVAMTGIIGLTGDFSEMDERQLETIAANIRFYRQWRSFIRSSRAYLLTPPVDRGCRNGWAGIQLQGLEDDKNLLFAYRLEDSSERYNFYLQGLREDGKYRIYTTGIHCDPIELIKEQSGRQLMKDGLLTQIGGRNEGTVYIIEQCH